MLQDRSVSVCSAIKHREEIFLCFVSKLIKNEGERLFLSIFDTSRNKYS